MRRREYLQRTTAAGSIAVFAGCLTDDDGSDGSTPAEDDSDGGTDSGSTSGPSDLGTMGLGAPLGLTGPYASEAEDSREAVELAAEEISNSDEFDVDIELTWEDDELDPSKSVQIARRMIREDGIDAIVGGPSSSSTGLAVAPLAADEKVPFLSPNGTDKLNGEDCNRYTFQMAASATMSARGTAPLALDNEDFGDRWYAITADYAWGHDVSSELESIAENNGKTWAGSVRSPFGTTDFSNFLNQAQNADPDVLFLIHYGTDNATAIEQAVSNGLHEDMEIVSPLALISASRAISPESLQHIWAGNNWYHANDMGQSQQFAEAFNDRVGRYPSDLAATMYKTTYQLLEAADRAGSTDGEAMARELEGAEYNMLKGDERIREEDHLNEQGYFVLRGKGPEQREYEDDHFEVHNFVEPSQVTPEANYGGACDLGSF